MRNNGFSLVRGLVLIIIGCLLIAVGFSLGGTWLTPQGIKNIFRAHKPFSAQSWENSKDKDFIKNTWEDNQYLDLQQNSNIQTASISNSITSLILDIKVAHISICSGTNPNYYISGFNAQDISVQTSQHNVILKDNRSNFWLRNQKENNKAKIEIVLPKHVEFSSIKISTKAGFVYVQDIVCKEFEFFSGAGVLEAIRLNANLAYIESGAGKIEIHNSDLNMAKLESGTGLIDFSGYLRGASRVSNGVGAIKLKLFGTTEDYFIQYEKGIQSVRAHNISKLETKNNWLGNKNALNTIQVSTGIGNTIIDFK